jgi:hypothetical protein
VSNRGIDQQAPKQREQDESLEALALGKGTDDQGAYFASYGPRVSRELAHLFHREMAQ